MTSVRLNGRQRVLVTALSTVGILASGSIVFAFVLGIVQNTVPWPFADSVREHYVAVGDSFSQGFMAGFFLCFFMMLVALVISGWVEERRAARGHQPNPR